MEQRTCGKGLAENAVLPSKLAELAASIARTLEVHSTALDLTDPSSREEQQAYQRLAAEHWEIASRLHATAAEMAGYRDLPMGRHDADAMADRKMSDTFRAVVERKQELAALLLDMVRRDREMLGGTS